MQWRQRGCPNESDYKTHERARMTLYKEPTNHTPLLVHVYRLFFPLFLTGVAAVADDEAPEPEPSANIDAILLGFQQSVSRGDKQKHRWNSPADVSRGDATLHLDHTCLALLHLLQLFGIQVLLCKGPVDRQLCEMLLKCQSVSHHHIRQCQNHDADDTHHHDHRVL